MGRKEDIAKRVEFVMTQRIKEALPPAKIQRATQLVANEALEDHRRKTMAGLDANGNPLTKKYTPGYERQKARYISGAQPRSRGKRAKRSGKRPQKTEYAARNVYDYMRLSGDMVSKMIVRLVKSRNDKNFIGGSFILDFSSTFARNKAGWNMARGFNFWGMPKPSSPRGRALNARLKTIFKRTLGFKGGGNLSIGGD